MPVEINVTGRFHVLDQPYAAPSKCAFCGLGHSQDGKVSFIDTTLDLDFYGVVYICSTCLTEIAASLDYVSPQYWKTLKESYDQIYDENDRLAAENAGLRDAVNILTGHTCISSHVSPESYAGEKEDPNYEDPASGVTSGVEPSEPKSDSSSSESGLSNVRGPAKPKPSSIKPKPSDDPLAEFDL
jgi:hypothetical protein